MLSNAYFLAKFRFDTAENEPAKNLQKFANFPNLANPKRRYAGPGPAAYAPHEVAHQLPGGPAARAADRGGPRLVEFSVICYCSLLC